MNNIAKSAAKAICIYSPELLIVAPLLLMLWFIKG